MRTHRTRRAWLTGAATTLLIMVHTAQAHHSFGMFDMKQNVSVEGTVKDFQWTNPHVWIDMMVVDPVTHTPVLWPVEADSVAIMSQRGWTRDTVKAGDKVTVVVHPLRTGAIGGSFVSASQNGASIGHELHFADQK